MLYFFPCSSVEFRCCIPGDGIQSGEWWDLVHILHISLAMVQWVNPRKLECYREARANADHQTFKFSSQLLCCCGTKPNPCLSSSHHLSINIWEVVCAGPYGRFWTYTCVHNPSWSPPPEYLSLPSSFPTSRYVSCSIPQDECLKENKTFQWSYNTVKHTLGSNFHWAILHTSVNFLDLSPESPTVN
jgi:hypothetical protein